MGSSLYPRRKRRHKKLLGGGGGKRCAISLPWVAVLVGLGMIAVVVVRKGIKASAREAAKAVERREKRAYPLAVLLEQHDIDDQVCVLLDLLALLCTLEASCWCLVSLHTFGSWQTLRVAHV